jgi:hypothetical protein
MLQDLCPYRNPEPGMLCVMLTACGGDFCIDGTSVESSVNT